MKWLTELVDEFSNEKWTPKQSRLTRMIKLWGNNPEQVMETAVNAYIINATHAFFPAISELRPYVDAAMSDYISGPQKRTEAGDDEIYEFELARGTMRSIGEIDAEIAAARNNVKRMLAQGS